MPKIISNKYFLLAIGGLFLFALCPSFAQAQSASDNLALIWSTNTYVPPSYPGKPLPTYDSWVTASIIPINSAASGLENLNYVWYVNGQKKFYGKNEMNFTTHITSLPGTLTTISVQIKDDQKNVLNAFIVHIPVVSPEIIIYPAIPDTDTPGLITGPITLSGAQEAGFVGLAYFYDISSPNDLKYQWTFDWQEFLKVEDAHVFNLKLQDEGIEIPVTKNLSLSAINRSNTVQSANTNINIIIRPSL